MRRRGLLGGALALLAAPAGAQPGFPARPVRVIIPFAPGGGTDNLARLIEGHVNRALGQNLVIETRPGAGGVIGSEAVMRAEPDGHTVLMTDASFSIIPGLYPRLPFDVLRDFAPVSLLATGSSVLLVHPSLAVRSVQELIALARARPGELSYASGGNGTGPHLAAELVKIQAGIEMTHVPYRGTGPATNDVVAGHVKLMFNGISAAKPHVDAGRLVALAVTGSQRNAALPDVPTFDEQGLPGIEAASNWGVLAPARTPDAVLRVLERAFATGVTEASIAARLEYLGFTPVGADGATYGRRLATDVERWTRVIRTAGVTME
ncbi:tripartite tricarboxylate transporter substrate binding protein [Falsiroseomonas ponticola]|uniref:tripartite tricarboxylate transporter substrate binding protein n=1 Tax=Falsiroseomonas ponticola TaxID=2786951 RepID=UPI001CF775C8|nr:tripartite tricarboxylate transporter substrate binding protein [Roseomonas ponticola]